MNMKHHGLGLVGLAASLFFAGCATDTAAPALGASGPSAKLQAFAADDNRVPTLDISRVDVIPQVRRQAPPRFPVAFRRQGRGGEAVVDFIVDENGVARDVVAIRATHPDFAAAASEAVAKWRFSPGRKEGRPVRTHMQVPVVFTLNGYNE
jgi:TonB family protein